MTSSSQLGSTGITMQFDLNRNIDAAARDVQAAINAARSYLPADLPSNPTYRKINPADSPVLILVMTSDAMTQDQMYDAADSIMGQKLSQIEGVGQVFVWGSSQPAVRIEANPNLLNKLDVGLEDVRTAIAAQNANQAVGQAAEWHEGLDTPHQRPAQESQGLSEPHRCLPQRMRRCGWPMWQRSATPIPTFITPAASTGSPACWWWSSANPALTSSPPLIASLRRCRSCRPRCRRPFSSKLDSTAPPPYACFGDRRRTHADHLRRAGRAGGVRLLARTPRHHDSQRRRSVGHCGHLRRDVPVRLLAQ